MDLVVGQPPAIAAASSAAEAAISAAAAAASAAAAAANAASVGFTAGDTVVNDGGRLEVAMPIKFPAVPYTIAPADRGLLIAINSTGVVTLPTGGSLGTDFYCGIRNNLNGATLTLTAGAGGNIDGVGSITVRAGECFLIHNNGSVNWRSIGRTPTGTSGGVVPLLNAANTWSADQTITSTNAGAGEGPLLDLYRNSASPAANDVLGAVQFTFNDSAGVKTTGPKIRALLVDPTDGSENASFSFDTRVNGSLVVRASLGNGLQVGSAPAAGDLGNGTVNVGAGYFVNGVRGAPVDYLEYRDVKPAGTPGGAATAGAWFARELNTEAHDAGGHGTLASNQLTLAAGTYEVWATSTAWAIGNYQLRLRDVSNNVTLVLGTTEYANQASGMTTRGSLAGRFPLAASTAVELQMRVEFSRATNGLGDAGPGTWGEEEVYTVLRLWKTA
jgi:hypothetical protein